MASLSANAGEPRNAIDRDALIDAIAQGLHRTWHCKRVWEAWHVGTMSQDDFEPVDDSETPTEIADAVLALLAAPPAAQAEGLTWTVFNSGAADLPEALRLAAAISNLLCSNEAAARTLAAAADELVRLHAESEMQKAALAAGQATAAQQGFSDGVASVSAGSEPVPNNRQSLEDVFRRLSDRAYCNYIEQIVSDVCLGWKYKARHGMFGEAELKGHTLAGEMLGRHKAFDEAANALRGSDAPLTHPSPQEGMAGWQPIETAPKDEIYRDGQSAYAEYILIWYPGTLAPLRARWWQADSGPNNFLADGGWAVFPTHWVPLPAAPGPADGESNG